MNQRQHTPPLATTANADLEWSYLTLDEGPCCPDCTAPRDRGEGQGGQHYPWCDTYPPTPPLSAAQPRPLPVPRDVQRAVYPWTAEQLAADMAEQDAHWQRWMAEGRAEQEEEPDDDDDSEGEGDLPDPPKTSRLDYAPYSR